MKKRRIEIIAFIAFIGILIAGCSVINQITQTAANLKNLQFKLESVNGFAVSGVKLSDKSSISSFSITDGAKLVQAFSSKSLPTEFVLNVAAINPNNGQGGSKQSTATLTSFAWTMYIDDVQTISGNIDKAIEIPGTGQQSIIPLRMSLDIYKFFGNKGYESLINLALAIGGVSGSPSKLKLVAQPIVQTPFGMLNAGTITIVDKQFN